MAWYCPTCKTIHQENQLCPRSAKQLRESPALLKQAVDFSSLAGQYGLVASQTLDHAAQAVNRVAGTHLSYEGSHQLVRDIQVFKRLNEEAFKRAGYFSSPEAAKKYLETLQKAGPRAEKVLTDKLTGYAQEVDWLRWKKSQLSAIWNKSYLLEGNAPGVDGETISRFTGKTISRTTIKATAWSNDAETTAKNIKQNIKKVADAIEKGNASPDDVIYGVKGTEQAARELGLKNKVIEFNSPEEVAAANDRLKGKIAAGQAVTAVTAEQAFRQMAQGAVIGAATGVTLSGIQTYLRYRNGEISREEAFSQISEDGVRSALTGAAMGGITLFLPAGPLGWVGGMAIGTYLNSACTNILDEIYGKGAYGEILNASGYVLGMSLSLEDALRQIAASQARAASNLKDAVRMNQESKENIRLTDLILEEY